MVEPVRDEGGEKVYERGEDMERKSGENEDEDREDGGCKNAE